MTLLVLLIRFRAQTQDREEAEGPKEGLLAATGAFETEQHPGGHRFDGDRQRLRIAAAIAIGDARPVAIGGRDGVAKLGGERQ